METYKKVLLLTGLIILLFVVYWIIKLVSNTHSTPIRPQYCNTPDCLGKSKDCSIMDPKTLISCTIPTGKEDDPCFACFGDMVCKPSIDATGPTAVDVRSLPGGVCAAPYVLENPNDQNSRCLIPDGNFCLPYNMPPVTCNKYTGRKVLGKAGDHTPYEWICLCKDDTQFTNDGNFLSDCDHIRACGMNGVTNDDKDGKRHLLDETGSLWNPTGPYNPFNGTCQCGPGEAEGKLSLTCVADQCYPGTACTDPSCDPSVSCACQEPLIDCHLVANRGGFYTGECPQPSCIPDPCYPGFYNPQLHGGNGGCDCSFNDQYVAVPTINSVVGETCINWCATSQNPCGDRGDCVVNTSPNADANASFIFTYITGALHNNSWMIRNGSDANTAYYWQLTNGNVTLQKGGTLTFFHIEADCATDPCPTVSTLKGSSKYYLKTSDDAQYIYISSTGKFTTVSSKASASSWMFVQDTDPKTGKDIDGQGRILVESILYAKITNDAIPILTVGTSTLNSPTCINCKVPNAQGPKNICETTCLENGRYPFGQHNCCSCDQTCSSSCIWCDDGDEECGRTCRGDGGEPGKISKYKWPGGCS